jgi:phosphomannomutase
VVGYEANGGFLLGFAAQGPAGAIAPLATRDCLLPLLAPLAEAKARGISLADLVASLPPVFTAADRVAEVPSEKSGAFIAELIASPTARAAFFETMGPEDGMDLTDGLRLRFASGAVVHLRPSGNAPECRCYAEAGTAEEAAALVTMHLAKLKARLAA